MLFCAAGTIHVVRAALGTERRPGTVVPAQRRGGAWLLRRPFNFGPARDLQRARASEFTARGSARPFSAGAAVAQPVAHASGLPARADRRGRASRAGRLFSSPFSGRPALACNGASSLGAPFSGAGRGKRTACRPAPVSLWRM